MAGGGFGGKLSAENGRGGELQDGVGQGLRIADICGEAAAAEGVFRHDAEVGTDTGAGLPEAFDDRESETF